MSARRLFLVLYDVSSAKTSNKVRERISAYAVGGPKSFKECLMNDRERRTLAAELQALINPETDRVHLLQLDPRMLAAAVGRVRRESFDPFLVL